MWFVSLQRSNFKIGYSMKIALIESLNLNRTNKLSIKININTASQSLGLWYFDHDMYY